MRLKLKNECYLGNPVPGEVDGEVGSPDIWNSEFRIQNQKNKKTNKYKNKKVKMKNLNDKKILNQLVEKYTANGVLSAINRLYENEEFEYNGYTPAMIQSLKDDYYIEENATPEEIEDFIDDRCMLFWADDPNNLAIQYVDQMISYKDYDTLADFIKRFNCLDYASIGSDYKMAIDDTDTDEDRDLDSEFLAMDDYEAGQYVVDNFYNGNLEEMIEHVSKRIHFSSYIDFAQAGENMLNLFDYTTGTDENGDKFYILIFY